MIWESLQHSYAKVWWGKTALWSATHPLQLRAIRHAEFPSSASLTVVCLGIWRRHRLHWAWNETLQRLSHFLLVNCWERNCCCELCYDDMHNKTRFINIVKRLSGFNCFAVCRLLSSVDKPAKEFKILHVSHDVRLPKIPKASLQTKETNIHFLSSVLVDKYRKYRRSNHNYGNDIFKKNRKIDLKWSCSSSDAVVPETAVRALMIT